MTAVNTLRRDLIERRLVPVVVGLAVAIVGIPALLLKTGSTPAPTKPAVSTTAGPGAPKTIVRPAAEPTLNNSDRKLVGRPKDLFK